jgi:hypothetical protein
VEIHSPTHGPKWTKGGAPMITHRNLHRSPHRTKHSQHSWNRTHQRRCIPLFKIQTSLPIFLARCPHPSMRGNRDGHSLRTYEAIKADAKSTTNVLPHGFLSFPKAYSQFQVFGWTFKGGLAAHRRSHHGSFRDDACSPRRC